VPHARPTVTRTGSGMLIFIAFSISY
jgi:hypothetical protein